MGAKQIQLSTTTLKKIAEALFLAYTEEQAAYLGRISKRTLARIRETPIWQEIQNLALSMEKPYRRKILKGEPGWQGAAWLLERKYPGQLSKPEVQLSLNTGAQTTNNTLVITAEQAQGLKNRNATIDEALAKLTPPSARADVMSPVMTLDTPSLTKVDSEGVRIKEKATSNSLPEEISNNNTDTKTLCEHVTAESPPAPGTRTPDAAASEPERILLLNSKILEPPTTKKKSVEIDRNSKGIPLGGIVEKPQLPQGGKGGKISEKVARELILKTKGNTPKFGPFGEKLPSKAELKAAALAAQVEEEEKRAAILAACPPIPKKRSQAPPIILRRPPRGPKSGRK